MSNVLIGIIGVILFIGLALAGALILGDDFKSASSSTQAAAAASQLQQVRAAAEMWKLKTGQSTILNQDTSFLVPRFLKVRAQNPTKLGMANQTHASPSAACRSLDHHWVTQTICFNGQALQTLIFTLVARNARNSGFHHQRLGACLVAHRAHGFGRWADEHQARF